MSLVSFVGSEMSASSAYGGAADSKVVRLDMIVVRCVSWLKLGGACRYGWLVIGMAVDVLWFVVRFSIRLLISILKIECDIKEIYNLYVSLGWNVLPNCSQILLNCFLALSDSLPVVFFKNTRPSSLYRLTLSSPNFFVSSLRMNRTTNSQISATS